MRPTATAFPKPLLFFILVMMTGCHSPVPDGGSHNQTSHSYAVQGIIQQISPDQRQATIHHQAIPGYMMEMTMDFPVDDAAELKGLVPGDEVVFTLVVDKDGGWIKDIRRIGHVDQTSTDASMSNDEVSRLKVGDKLPDGDLLTESGQPIHLSDFHGKVVAFTFFFTRCPLPNYCPLMNRNFAEARTLLLASEEGRKDNWQLLSISFDPSFDRPETLASYASVYRGANADHWLFASASPVTLAKLAPPLGLIVMGQDVNLSHNLRTVVVDAEGRIFCQFNDNLWTPQQLADAMREAMRKSHSK